MMTVTTTTTRIMVMTTNASIPTTKTTTLAMTALRLRLAPVVMAVHTSLPAGAQIQPRAYRACKCNETSGFQSARCGSNQEGGIGMARRNCSSNNFVVALAVGHVHMQAKRCHVMAAILGVWQRRDAAGKSANTDTTLTGSAHWRGNPLQVEAIDRGPGLWAQHWRCSDICRARGLRNP